VVAIASGSVGALLFLLLLTLFAIIYFKKFIRMKSYFIAESKSKASAKVYVMDDDVEERKDDLVMEQLLYSNPVFEVQNNLINTSPIIKTTAAQKQIEWDWYEMDSDDDKSDISTKKYTGIFLP